jgi:hypothetical protein
MLMRIATYNIENLFLPAKVLNLDITAAARPRERNIGCQDVRLSPA